MTIVTEIGTLIQSEPKLVMSAIAQDPLGKISGMFNMLIHKYQINQLKGDGVTRTLPSLTLMEQSDAHKNIRKESTCIKISTARSSQQRKAYTATATSRRPDYCTPRTAVDDNRNVKPDVNHNMIKNKHINIMANRKEDNSPKYRPSTIQIASNEKKCHMPDYRLIKTPTLRRKAYSANITPKTNRPFSPAPDEKRKQVDALPNKGGSPSPILANMSKKDHQLPVIGKRGISDALNAINRLPCNRATKQTFMQQHRYV
ncbi:hypothetical protein NQ314_011960 [Rhamnusium bicolor]|uniref:Uncharacterized protein n=1 Tax=Rhamnusium bicolor TaxID=1586634 RepID=A0AAV8XEB1_9CUCU|nr:hypothetical protein NQ314_011960 [Rhamnusium bicolor]